jgi:hypothetical protein
MCLRFFIESHSPEYILEYEIGQTMTSSQFHDHSSEHSMYDLRYCQRHKTNHKKIFESVFVFYL